jgi:hypothetical protein
LELYFMGELDVTYLWIGQVWFGKSVVKKKKKLFYPPEVKVLIYVSLSHMTWKKAPILKLNSSFNFNPIPHSSPKFHPSPPKNQGLHSSCLVPSFGLSLLSNLPSLDDKDGWEGHGCWCSGDDKDGG